MSCEHIHICYVRSGEVETIKKLCQQLEAFNVGVVHSGKGTFNVKIVAIFSPIVDKPDFFIANKSSKTTLIEVFMV